MPGTVPGPGSVPHTKNVILASADQVAIDAVAAKLMGFDPLSIKFIRLAHDAGLGCGDPRDIRIVGDETAAAENWHFVGPFKKMTFASRMQHRIYWGPLRKPLAWSLKTVLAPWAYLASVLYHDTFWYPLKGAPSCSECSTATGVGCSAAGRTPTSTTRVISRPPAPRGLESNGPGSGRW